MVFACLCGMTHARAQDPSSDSVRASALTSLTGGAFEAYDPWSDPDSGAFAPRSAGDSDLGDQLVLMPQGGYRPFAFQLTERALWTSNAALTDVDELEDFYSNTDLNLSFVPQIAGNTYGEVTAGYSFFRYADHSELDFDSLEASAGIIHVFREFGDLSAWVRYKHNRLLTARGHDEIFTDHAVEAGLYFPVPLGARHFAYGSLSSEFSIDGNPDFARRDEHGFTGGYRFTPSDRIELASFYRFALLDYTEGGRTDLLHTAGLSLTAKLTKAIDLTLSGTYSLNDSDAAGGDYEVGDLGGILSMKLEF